MLSLTWHSALLLARVRTPIVRLRGEKRQISPTGTKIENWSARDTQGYRSIATLPGYDGLVDDSGCCFLVYLFLDNVTPA